MSTTGGRDATDGWQPRRAAVVISGPPASGKSTVAQALHDRLGWPLLARDGLKEALFDTLGTGDREWSRRLGGASWRLFVDMAQILFATGGPFLLDNNFRPPVRDIITLAERGRYQLLEVRCATPDALLIDRFRARWESGARHRGHADAEGERDFAHALSDGMYREESLGLGPVLVVDTRRSTHRVVADILEWLPAVLT